MNLTIANTHLDAWLAADLAVSNGQSYSIADRQLTYGNISEIRTQIAYWQRMIDGLTASAAGGSGVALACWGGGCS